MNTLFDVDDLPKTATLRDKFNAFNSRNPKVLAELERMANQLILRGRKRISTKMLFENLRYDFYMTTDDPDSEFRLNNNMTPYYARLMIQRHPDWDGLFQLREVHESPAILVRRKAS